jgi:uncharacterized membrane protein YbhN (UPF0104 family)
MLTSALSRNLALAYKRAAARGRAIAMAHHPVNASARRSRLILILVWAALAAGLALAASSLSWGEVMAAGMRADPRWLLIALLVHAANAPLWALCWRCLIGRKDQVPMLSLTRVLAVVAAAVQAFSLLGGGATAFLLITGRLGRPQPVAASLLVLDGLTTGLVKVLLVGAALALAPGAAALRGVGVGLLAGMALGLVGLIVVSRSRTQLHKLAARFGGRQRIWIERFGDWTAHLEAVRSPARLGGAVFFMLARRLTEGLAGWCVAIGCGVPVGPEMILLVAASIAVVTLIPSPPGNVGLYELAVVAAYQWVGVAPETALAVALLQHALFLLAMLAPGALIVALDSTFLARTARP